MERSKRWKEKRQNPLDFVEARNGDHAMVSFECDQCIFVKLKNRLPTKFSQQDKLLLIMIRRINLDAFWARQRSTVRENTSRVKLILQSSNTLGLKGPFEHTGPCPPYDHCGYELAINMLMHSRRPGKYSKTHTQFETVRMLRSAYSSHVRTTPNQNVNQLSWVDKKGQYVRLTDDKCGTLWFSRFMIGLKTRMGHTFKPNMAMSHLLLKSLIHRAEDNITDDFKSEESAPWVVFVAYVVITYVLSLRGTEGQMLELGGLRKHWDKEGSDHFIVVLWGEIKGEEGYREHLIPCVKVTKSGFNVRYTIERLIELKYHQKLVTGPAISDNEGALISTKELDRMMHEILVDLYSVNRTLFPPSIETPESILESYKCFRTFRRTSDTRALEEKVSQTDIDIVNKWEHMGLTKRKTSQPMRQHYAQFELLVKPFIRYTYAM